MNLVWCSRKNKKPVSFCFGFFHRNGEIFRKLETAVAIVGKENEYHGLFFVE